MEEKALLQLTALSHPQRLGIFRLLVRRLPDELPAGEISGTLAFKANTGSVYLATLLKAGLISQRRQGTSLLYRANLETAGELLQFLASDCCRDRVDVRPVLAGLDLSPAAAALATKQNVLFTCTGNSARSICAEAILRKVAPQNFNVYSAGTSPAEAPNPLILEMLAAKGHPVARLHSKNLSLFQRDQAPKMHFVITLCDHAANEECPPWSGNPLNAHWGVPDPISQAGSLSARRETIMRTYTLMETKIERFVRLDMQNMRRVEVQRALDDIGAQ